MDEQRHRAAGGRRRRKARPKRSPTENREPLLIVARRPDAPRTKIPSRSIAASARPRNNRGQASERQEAVLTKPVEATDKPRRLARIVQATTARSDDLELVRQKLLRRLLEAEGRGAISKAADALAQQEIAVPEEQEHQVQLLEHVDERRAREAMAVISRLLERQPPVKRPILERRLRRLEEEADEAETRERAAALRKTLRVA